MIWHKTHLEVTANFYSFNKKKSYHSIVDLKKNKLSHYKKFLNHKFALLMNLIDLMKNANPNLPNHNSQLMKKKIFLLNMRLKVKKKKMIQVLKNKMNL